MAFTLRSKWKSLCSGIVGHVQNFFPTTQMMIEENERANLLNDLRLFSMGIKKTTNEAGTDWVVEPFADENDRERTRRYLENKLTDLSF
jgi:hypothetical protein